MNKITVKFKKLHTKTKIPTKYRGVYSRRGKYVSSYTLNDKNINSPYFSSAEDAASWYDEQVFKVFGDFAKLNFPENYGIAQEGV